ncbi:xylosyl- and glucuronyltransferase LARGE1-like isoform X2 [Plodia interpunctella]|uniref:xylosyl- and glucuronyltransferase LARGE1-like isoform X2 n=1 Tax=Plodia interpunctella TaxID=58824 RepID=UPI002368DE3C|nr:xylosyl- and glucuronyltransferase LARGE1-like isoform X2 [Plodia interpunctella]
MSLSCGWLRVTKSILHKIQWFTIPESTGSLCETVHVSFICMGKCMQVVTPMLKSLLHHRQNPIHFHLIVDGSTEKIINELFRTWDLDDVKYTCYNAEHKFSVVRWIPNTHYSGIYSLTKLLLPEILPESLDKVIVLDYDLTFLCDVVELWILFKEMNEEQIMGLVENESDWYLKPNRWPAIGLGFNTGVMLWDLQKIRKKVFWTRLWQDEVYTNLPNLKMVQLADQDVLNAVIKKNPQLVYVMSCKFNVQMSTRSWAKTFYKEDINNIKIIHWNSPSKQNINIQDADVFRNIYQSYVNLDGNLLKEKLHRCNITENLTYKMNHSDLCISFRAAQRVKLRTHIYYMDYSYKSIDNFDVTLVLQFSMDRLQFLERLVKYWEGPISAAIYLADCEVSKFESYIRNLSGTLSTRRNIAYHLVFHQDNVHYPVNYMRNVALANVDTPYVFLMDADFVPMIGLYEYLRKAIRLTNPYPQKKCLVVPAFETQRYRATPPRNKSSLLARWSATGDVAPFRAREWPRGHRATNYTRWATATAPYEVEWQTDYEPYVVVHRSVPKYDTRFSGFGWNKVSHSVELRAQRYKPVVLPDAFVLHTAHAPSHDITAFRADPHYRICLAILKQEFLEDLEKKYNVTLKEEKPDTLYSGKAKSILLNKHGEQN